MNFLYANYCKNAEVERTCMSFEEKYYLKRLNPLQNSWLFFPEADLLEAHHLSVHVTLQPYVTNCLEKSKIKVVKCRLWKYIIFIN